MAAKEEPPMEVSNFQMEIQYMEGEVMEEGQEEWLSEGILTDDDYNPASQQTEPDQNDSQVVTSQDSNMASMDGEPPVEESETIEETLNNFEVKQDTEQKSAESLLDDLDAFLIRKTDGKVVETQPKESDVEESKHSDDDDGNDTDDLLRVLGDGDQKAAKEEVKMIKDGGESSDDDEFIFTGAQSKTIAIAKSALMKATASKAEPEDDVTDCSSDEATTVQKMFEIREKKHTDTTKVATTKVPNSGNTKMVSAANNKMVSAANTQTSNNRSIIKKVVHIPQKQNSVQHTRPTNTPQQHKRLNTSHPEPKSDTKPKSNFNLKEEIKSRSILKPRSDFRPKSDIRPKSDTRPKSDLRPKSDIKPKLLHKQSEEIINEDEFMEDEIYDLDEDFTQRDSIAKKPAQRLMTPEAMDEEVPTDPDSDSDEESLYDELPSSESDNEDWFTLDIRAERAADYIPLLGDQAYQLLLDEKRRVSEKLQAMKQNLSALVQSGKEQADRLKDATATAAELDALLRAG